MKPYVLRAQIEILEWAVRITLSGMPLGMVRYLLLKKQQELEERIEAMGETS